VFLLPQELQLTEVQHTQLLPEALQTQVGLLEVVAAAEEVQAAVADVQAVAEDKFNE